MTFTISLIIRGLLIFQPTQKHETTKIFKFPRNFSFEQKLNLSIDFKRVFFFNCEKIKLFNKHIRKNLRYSVCNFYVYVYLFIQSTLNLSRN